MISRVPRGTSSAEVLAVMSFLLCGLAGPDAWLGGQNDGAPLAKLDLLVRRRDRAVGRMAGQCVGILRYLNRSLTAGLADFSPDCIRLTQRGAFAGGTTARFADPEDTRKARDRIRKVLGDSGAESHSLDDDMEYGKEAVRTEAVLHPQFLLESVRCRELEAALDLCHQRTAVVVGLKTESGRAGSEPARDLRGLLDLMEGLATPRWEGSQKGEEVRSRVIPLKAHVLLEAGDDDLAVMTRLLPELAGRFLWLAPADSGTLKPQRRLPGQEAELMPIFNEAARKSSTSGGWGRPLVSIALTMSIALDFARYGRVMDRYRRWIGYLEKRYQLDPGPVVSELPGALVFGLGFLCCHHDGGNGFASTKSVMVQAFRSALRLARRHCIGLALHLKEEQLAQGLELAGRIVSKLEEKGPLSRRELVRCFSDQRWEVFEPVIEPLTELGVLVWGGDGKLEPGDGGNFRSGGPPARGAARPGRRLGHEPQESGQVETAGAKPGANAAESRGGNRSGNRG